MKQAKATKIAEPAAAPVIEPAKEQRSSEPAEKKVKQVKVLDKKKTVLDNKGDAWEVVEKREKITVEKEVGSDSDVESELSF